MTPHGKWNIHTMYYDNLEMLTLFRGGPTVWMSPQDAEAIDVKDNDWIELYNRNGVVTARAVVSHRMPKGSLYMYHAQDNEIYEPLSTITGNRGARTTPQPRSTLSLPTWSAAMVSCHTVGTTMAQPGTSGTCTRT